MMSNTPRCRRPAGVLFRTPRARLWADGRSGRLVPLWSVIASVACTVWLSSAAWADPLSDRLAALAPADEGYDRELAELVGAADVTDEALERLADVSEDWRVRQQASVIWALRHAGEAFEAIQDMRPRRTRARFLRFSGDWPGEPTAAAALLDRFLRSEDDAEVRRALIDALAFSGGDWGQAIAALWFEETDPEVRGVMTWLLRDVDGEYAIPTLRAAFGDESERVRAQAADTAAYHNSGREMADELLAALSDPNLETRAFAARAMGWLQIEHSLESLEDLLADDAPEVRLNALVAIERLDPNRARRLPSLDLLRHDGDRRVRRLAQGLAADLAD